MIKRVSGPVFWRQVLFGIGTLAVVIAFLLTFSSILLPFVAGMALAYFLDPVADRLERLGLSRMMATVLILVSFVVIFVLSLVIIIPVLVTQLNDFITNIPDYVSQLQALIAKSNASWVPKWLNGQVSTQMAAIKGNFSRYLAEGAGFIGTLLSQLWNSGKALLDIISLLVVTPVVAFYLLLDWDRMMAKLDSLIPRNQVGAVREIAREMNRTIAGFVRGQGSLCLILGIYYAVGLSLIGLNFGLLIGFFTGMISFIPYVGSSVGLILALGMAAVQFWPDYLWVVITGVFFFTGQFLEGNVLQPKLVGSSVGLHPVWLMFAMFAFGSLFGFLGVLVAVPCAAAVGVLVRFAVRRYLDSDLYYGEEATVIKEVRPPVISET
ncbi:MULTISPECIES: AI-2E family transporter [Rhizobium/Agrobacterium group]|uniref:AI-2E family transporter n=1 Tax=Agrobacterium vitis TaxID=373 RepID=A0AAE2REY2_AGRVI|nr:MULTISPECIES: AI-2E family transporter [Rhizobium/Agrobacterium group]MBF2716547.1 AI-2E family transporter [Agrobacterium vitis]MCF1459866.1 AI-2E family transporter [Allorhizobium ampelinum]MCF1472696.1 AI-2E family transporter [Allorhizobium ampelinum]MCF1481946.1 AI-2E family transporter [Allorhizobium ampelinum]MUZ64193.1 AI-2E family transporter [Agrobacterium vitis]